MLRAGVDLGGTKIEALVVDDDQRPIGQSRQATPTSGGPTAVLETIALAVRDASSGTGGTDALAGVGIGSPGVVDTEAGTVTSARNLTDWDGTFPLGPGLSDALGGITVRVGNDVALALDAEIAFGAGRSYPSMLGV